MKAITGFGYMRFHGIFDDEVGVYGRDKDGTAVYYLIYVDQIYDGLLANSVRPFVEIQLHAEVTRGESGTAHAFPGINHILRLPTIRWNGAQLIYSVHASTCWDATGRRKLGKWYPRSLERAEYRFLDRRSEKGNLLLRSTTLQRARLRRWIRIYGLGGPSTAQAAWVDRVCSSVTTIRRRRSTLFPRTFTATKRTDGRFRGQYGTGDSQRHGGGGHPEGAGPGGPVQSAPKTPIIVSEYNATYLSQPQVNRQRIHGSVAGE